jgi:hypothetical protein
MSEHVGWNQARAAQVAPKKVREQIRVDALEQKASLLVEGLSVFFVELRIVGVQLVRPI